MSFKLFGVIACLLLAGAMPSQATTVYVTYTGTIGNGFPDSATDRRGFFGPAGSDLNGERFEAAFVFDVTFGLNNYNVASPTETSILGGSNYAGQWDVSPSLGATLSIGGHSLSVGGSVLGNISALNNGGNRGLSSQSHWASDGAFTLWLTMYNFHGIYSELPVSIDTAFTYALMPGDTSFGGLGVNAPDGGHLFLQGDRLTVSLTAPIATPLPAALPLFATAIGGLGLLGWWRRKRKAVVTA